MRPGFPVPWICVRGTAFAALIAALPVAAPSQAAVVEYELHIADTMLVPAGTMRMAMTINGGIPGPTLRFREGDTARIRVFNDMHHHSTSTHWHGLLVPVSEDGVPDVTTPPIEPHSSRTFEFPIRQAGTYWYHSHTHLQEQSGVYGPIVITPRGGETVEADRDHVVMLSDWTDENPHEVLRTLLRGSDWYSIQKGTMQSVTGAMHEGALKDFFGREWQRMRPMDISDIAYDAFLINGSRESRIPGRPGERIRLRFINGGAGTYFFVTSATGPMTIVAADGQPVEPLKVERLLIAIAETYDVIVTIPSSGEWELRATAQDGSGHASLLIGAGVHHTASDPPKADLYRMDHMLDGALDEGEGPHKDRPTPPYPLLRSTRRTALPAHLPVRTLPLRLTGDMERYTWSINGRTIAQDGIITVHRGEVLRLELTNDTMMHHPIHLHGHFFRVLNGQGARSPLKHTVDLPPMGRRTIEFEADESGDWMMHCHVLYHMMAGMARVFSYDDQGADHLVKLGEHAMEMWTTFGTAAVESHMSEGSLVVRHPRQEFIASWETGWDHVDAFEYETDLVYDRYFGPNFNAFAGARLTNIADTADRAVAGISCRLPLMAWATAQIDSEGDARFTLAKHLQLTPRLDIFARVQYDTRTQWEWTAGLERVLAKPLSIIAQYHSDYGVGAGFTIRF